MSSEPPQSPSPNSPSIAVDQAAMAFYAGTESLCELMENRIEPLLSGQQSLTSYERTIVVTFRRMALLARSLVALDEIRHFQVVAATTRSLFELTLDLVRLEKKLPDDVSRFAVFTTVSKFRNVQKLATFLQDNPEIDRDPFSVPLSFASDDEQRLQCESWCAQYWGKDGKGKLNWPEHWSGLPIAQRAKEAGPEYEAYYRGQYFLMSTYVHAGATGILGLSHSALTSVFGFSHWHAQKFLTTAIEVTAKELQLFTGDPELKCQLQRARCETDLVLMRLEVDQEIGKTPLAESPLT